MSDDLTAIVLGIRDGKPTWPGEPIYRHELSTGEWIVAWDEGDIVRIQIRGVRVPGVGVPYADMPVTRAMLADVAPDVLGRLIVEELRAAVQREAEHARRTD